MESIIETLSPKISFWTKTWFQKLEILDLRPLKRLSVEEELEQQVMPHQNI